MAITLTGLDFTGSPDDYDKDAANLIVDQENERRAALDPPLPLLPKATGAQLKSSYLIVLTDIVTAAHASYTSQAAEAQAGQANIRELWLAATNAQRAPAIAALGG